MKTCIEDIEVAIIALNKIVNLDPEEDAKNDMNEWGEAECFTLAQKIAKEALHNIQKWMNE